MLYSRQVEFGPFATVFVAVFDLCSGDISYFGAGHPPAFICRAGGSIETLRIGQAPLALLEEQHFVEHRLQFDIGDKLVLYTDGISEARHNNSLLDLEGVARLLGSHSALPANELAKTLIQAATDWAGGKLQDDAAVVVENQA